METKNVGFLIIAILLASGGAYVLWPEAGLKVQVDPNSSTFYVWENETWAVGGVEYVTLWNGSRKLLPVGEITVLDEVDDATNFTTIRRFTPYENGIVIAESYGFNGTPETKEQFPVWRIISVVNGSGLILQYQVKQLTYEGTGGDVASPQNFGKNMRVEWQPGAYYSKLTKQSDGGNLIVKYRVMSNNASFQMKVFDPPWTDAEKKVYEAMKLNLSDENVHTTHCIACHSIVTFNSSRSFNATGKFLVTLDYLNGSPANIPVEVEFGRDLLLPDENGTERLERVWSNDHYLHKGINYIKLSAVKPAGESVDWNFQLINYSVNISGTERFITADTRKLSWALWTIANDSTGVWHFNQSASPFVNRTGNTLNGTVSGSPTYAVTGPLDKYVNFTADGQFANFSEPTLLDIDGVDFSYVAYVNTQSYSNDPAIFGKGPSATRAGIGLGILNTGQVRFIATGDDFNTGHTAVLNQWQCYGMTYLDSNRSARFYVNSSSYLATKTFSADLTGGNAYSWEVGQFSVGYGFYRGGIEEILFFRRQLSGAEVNSICANWSSGVAFPGTPDAPPSNAIIWLQNISNQTLNSMNSPILSLQYNASNSSNSCYVTPQGYTTNSTLVSSLATFNDGLLVGGILTNATGKYGNGTTADGVDDYIVTGNSSQLNVGAGITISLWAKPTSLQSNTPRLIMRGTAASFSYALTPDAGGDNMRCLFANSTATTTLTDPSTFSAGSWYYWSCTYDAATQNITLWRNASAVASTTFVEAVKNVTNNFSIGAASNAAAFANYTFDEVRVWNRSLSGTELGAEMNSAIPISGSGIVLSLSFERANSTHAYDTDLFYNSSDWFDNRTGDFYISGPDPSKAGFHSTSVCAVDNCSNMICQNITLNITFASNVTGILIDGVLQNVSVELNSPVNVSATINNGTVCFDVDHPAFGANYACGTNTTSFLFNATYMERKTLNDSSYYKNLTYGNMTAQNQTIGILAHQHDQVDNVTIYLSGFQNNGSYPASVKVYVNNTLSNTIGLVTESSSSQTTAFNDSSTSKLNLFETPATDTVGYIKLPKNADVSSATVTLSGLANTTLQENYDAVGVVGNIIYVNYTKPNGSTNQTTWQIKVGDDVTSSCSGTAVFSNLSIPAACWNANATKLIFKMTTYKHGTNAIANNSFECYNGSQYIGVRSVNGSNFQQTNAQLTGQSFAVAYDANYDTGVFYDAERGDWRYDLGDVRYCPAHIYEEGVYWLQTPVNAWMEVGSIDGTREFDNANTFSTTNVTANFSSAINTYLESCTADSQGYCTVPIYMYSEGGSINISNVSINYTYNINPVVLNKTYFEQYLDRINNFSSVPIQIEVGGQGIVQISNISYQYAGGNSTVNITAHSTDYSANSSLLQVLMFHSRTNYTFPPNVQYLEFIPRSQTAKNVTPYGQTSTRPILNITGLNYGNKAFNFSILANESYSCVNLSVATTNNKSNATRLGNNTWVYFTTGVTYQSYFGLYMWADYQCANSAWRVWQPNLYFRACATGTICANTTS